MGVFDLKKGDRATITAVNIYGAAGQRLRSLGIERGAKITVLAYSLFNGGVLVLCGYNRIAIRKSVACRIEVSAC